MSEFIVKLKEDCPAGFSYQLLSTLLWGLKKKFIYKKEGQGIVVQKDELDKIYAYCSQSRTIVEKTTARIEELEKELKILAGLESVMHSLYKLCPQNPPTKVSEGILIAQIEKYYEHDWGQQHIQAIKKVREMTNWGLKEAKDWCEALRAKLWEGKEKPKSNW